MRGTSLDCNSNDLPDECEASGLGLRSLVGRTSLLLDALPWSLFVGDYNGDGLLDVGAGTTSALVFSFGSSNELPALDEPHVTLVDGLAQAWGDTDLEGDGDLDVVALLDAEIRLFVNDGEGKFQAAGRIPFEAGLVALATGDVDGDGVSDIAVTNRRTDGVFLSRGEGGGRFGEAVSEAVGDFPHGVKMGDLDGDGALDLVVLNRDSDDATLLFVSVDGTIRARRSLPAGRPRPERLAVAEFTGDGALDIVFFHWDEVVVFENQGKGDFIEVDTFQHERNRPTSTAVGDMDGDGDLDLTATSLGDEVRVIWNDGVGGLFAGARFATGRSLAAAVELGDADGDGDFDFFLGVQQPPGVVVVLNADDGQRRASFSDPLTYPQGPSAALNPHGIALADVDGDDDLDAITANGDLRSVVVLRNDGRGALLGDPSWTWLAGGDERLDPVVAADLDADGDVDVVTAGLSGGGVVVLPNDGHGGFGDRIRYPGERVNMLSLEDMDGNGTLDVLSANTSANSVGLYWNPGDGTFAEHETFPVGAGVSAVVGGDFDGDGDMDIAASNRGSFSVSIVLQQDTRSFSERERIALLAAPEFLVVGDFDGDGDPDLATANRDATADVLLNDGQGVFSSRENFALRDHPFSMITADLTGDGALDLISANEGTSTLRILTGLGDGTFWFSAGLRVLHGARFVAAGDMDGDGHLDLVTANRGSDDLSVLINESAGSRGGDSFIETICTLVDFLLVSLPTPGDAVRSSAAAFLLPAREDAALLPPLFPNLERFSLLRDFLAIVFPERFPALDPTQYLDLVGRRRSRAYFAGGVHQLRLEGGVAYGFDVVTDAADPTEELTRDEVRRVFEILREAFRLEPLVYFPRTAAAREAAATWDGPDLPVLLVAGPPEKPPLPGTPTFTLEVPPGLAVCGTFATAGIDRGLREEYELKSTVRLRGGELQLPTIEDSVEKDLFEEVRFGPAQEVVRALGPGVFRLNRIPGVDGVTVYRFTHHQEFALEDGRKLSVSWVRPIDFRAHGDERIDERLVIEEELFAVEVGREVLQATLDDVPLVRYGSCTYETLPRFEIQVDLADGTRLHFEERFLEAESLLATGPASLSRAELVLPGELDRERHVVEDYWSLVYSAQKHNTVPGYWVLFDEALRLEGLDGDVRAVEVVLSDPPSTVVEAAYLGQALEPLRQLAGSYQKAPLARPGARFLRGDAGADGRLDVTDALAILHHLFRRGALACARAGDADDNGQLNLIDALEVLAQLFGRVEPLPAPFPECGEDGTEDSLSCEEPPTCG